MRGLLLSGFILLLVLFVLTQLVVPWMRQSRILPMFPSRTARSRARAEEQLRQTREKLDVARIQEEEDRVLAQELEERTRRMREP